MKSDATLTIRNVPARVVRELKDLAKRQGKSMEQQVREVLEQYVVERASVLKQMRAAWEKQLRRPSAEEIQAWIRAGRE